MTQTAAQAISAQAKAFARKRVRKSAKRKGCHAAAPTSVAPASSAARWMDLKMRNATFLHLFAAMVW
jgi:hypothetical protein